MNIAKITNDRDTEGADAVNVDQYNGIRWVIMNNSHGMMVTKVLSSRTDNF